MSLGTAVELLTLSSIWPLKTSVNTVVTVHVAASI